MPGEQLTAGDSSWNLREKKLKSSQKSKCRASAAPQQGWELAAGVELGAAVLVGQGEPGLGAKQHPASPDSPSECFSALVVMGFSAHGGYGDGPTPAPTTAGPGGMALGQDLCCH